MNAMIPEAPTHQAEAGSPRRRVERFETPYRPEFFGNGGLEEHEIWATSHPRKEDLERFEEAFVNDDPIGCIATDVEGFREACHRIIAAFFGPRVVAFAKHVHGCPRELQEWTAEEDDALANAVRRGTMAFEVVQALERSSETVIARLIHLAKEGEVDRQLVLAFASEFACQNPRRPQPSNWSPTHTMMLESLTGNSPEGDQS